MISYEYKSATLAYQASDIVLWEEWNTLTGTKGKNQQQWDRLNELSYWLACLANAAILFNEKSLSDEEEKQSKLYHEEMAADANSLMTFEEETEYKPTHY